MSAVGIIALTDKYFRIAFTWSVLFVVGIPMIVFGAINLLKEYTFL